MIEPKRYCGFRQVGGLYLCGPATGQPCDRLPFALTVCPVCSCGIKQARGWTWLSVDGVFQGPHTACMEFNDLHCPLCDMPSLLGRAGLIWVGAQFYATAGAFNDEAAQLGLSRRIAALPRDFELGKTWVLLAHPLGANCEKCSGTGIDPAQVVDGVAAAVPKEQLKCPVCEGEGKVAGIFKMWMPQRVEKICRESERGTPEVERLVKRNIQPVFVPDGDPEHDPKGKVDAEIAELDDSNYTTMSDAGAEDAP